MNPLWILFKCVLRSNKNITSTMGGEKEEKIK